MFISMLSTISIVWKEPKCPLVGEWINKMWYVCMYVYTHTHTHTHTMEYYSAIKKNEILPFATMWMELEGIMLSKMSQSEKDKYHMISLMWNLRNKRDKYKGREGKIR